VGQVKRSLCLRQGNVERKLSQVGHRLGDVRQGELRLAIELQQTLDNQLAGDAQCAGAALALRPEFVKAGFQVGRARRAKG